MNLLHDGLTVHGRERFLAAGAIAGFTFAACMTATAIRLFTIAVRVARTPKKETPS